MQHPHSTPPEKSTDTPAWYPDASNSQTAVVGALGAGKAHQALGAPVHLLDPRGDLAEEPPV